MTLQPDWHKTFPPSDATRGQFVPIKGLDTLSPAYSGRGRYLIPTYIIGSEPGSINLGVSSVTLNVSTINIDEPVDVKNSPNYPLSAAITNFGESNLNATNYGSVDAGANSVTTITFTPAIKVLELYNNDASLPVYVSFNNGTLPTLSATALPLVAEGFYSVEREVSALYIGNTDPSSTVDVRIVGHYRT